MEFFFKKFHTKAIRKRNAFPLFSSKNYRVERASKCETLSPLPIVEIYQEDGNVSKLAIFIFIKW